MSLSDANLEVFWAITAADKLLSDVEQFLINVDEPCLQQKLNKLTQDVGLALADDLLDPELEQHPERTDDLEGVQRLLKDVDPAQLHDAPVLMKGYEPITQDRLKIFDEVRSALEAYGSEHCAAYGNFLATLKGYQRVDAAPSVTGPLPPSP
jgi:hypothetical protein